MRQVEHMSDQGKASFAYVEPYSMTIRTQARGKKFLSHADILIARRIVVTSPQSASCQEAETIRLIAAVDRAIRAMRP